MNDDKPQRHLRPPQRDAEQEAQRRHGPIDGSRTNGALMLIKLKAPEIFNGGGIGRLTKKGSEAPNVADVILLRVLPKPTHLHILQHPLTQRCVRGDGSNSNHGEFLSVEGTRMVERRRLPAQSLSNTTLRHPKRPSRAAGSCSGRQEKR